MVGLFNDWFSGSGSWNNAYSSPWYIIIDENFTYIDLLDNKDEVVIKLNELLDEEIE